MKVFLNAYYGGSLTDSVYRRMSNPLSVNAAENVSNMALL